MRIAPRSLPVARSRSFALSLLLSLSLALSIYLPLAIAPSAAADNLPLPQGLSLDQVANAVVCADLQVSCATVLDAYDAYVKGLERALVAADADLLRMRKQARLPADAYMGSADAKRFNEIDVRSQEAARVLASALVDRLAEAAPGQESQVMAVRDAILIACERAQIDGGSSGVREISSPPDLWEAIESTIDRMNDGAFAAQRPSLLLLQTANAAGRIGSMRAFQDAVRESRLACAKVAEEFKVVHQTADEVRAADQELWKEAARAGTDSATVMAAMERARALSATNHLFEFRLGPGKNHAAWADMVKEQLVAYAHAEPLLTPTVRADANRYWLPGLADARWSDLDLPLPAGSWGTDPPGFVQSVLRMEGLDESIREKVRTIGRAWVAADAAIFREAAKQLASGGAVQDPTEARKELAAKMLASIAKAAALPTLVAPEPSFPERPLTAEITSADEIDFGAVVKPTVPTEASERARAQSQLRPWKYAPDMVDDLSALLRLTPEQRTVLEVIMTDARDRWSKEVAPLVEKSLEKESGLLRTREDRARWQKNFAEAVASAEGACQAAYACDEKLFSDLRGAFGAGVDGDTLALASAARRTGEATLTENRSVTAGVAARPVDVPRAVLTAPLSVAGRAAAIAAAAPHAPKWDALGRERSRFLRQIRPLRMDGREWSESSGMSQEEFAARLKAFDEGFERTNAAWMSAERDAIDAIAAVLSAEDAAAWHASITRLRWPPCYYSVDGIRRAAEVALAKFPATDPLRAEVEAVLVAGERDATLSGNAAVAMMEVVPLQLDPLSATALAGADSAARLRALRSLDWSRWQVLAERVRLLLPADSTLTLRRSSPVRRLCDRDVK